MQSNPIRLEMTEEEAEKIEVTCGFCDRKIRIGSFADHVRIEHSQSFLARS